MASVAGDVGAGTGSGAGADRGPGQGPAASDAQRERTGAASSSPRVAIREVEDHVLLAGALDEECKTTAGSDTEGRAYDCVLHMWDKFLRLSEVDVNSRAVEEGKIDRVETAGRTGIAGWYGLNASYWEGTPATYDGIMGGLPEIGESDIEESGRFLTDVAAEFCCGRDRALDVGAGIGRITADLLRHHAARVDLVERNPAFAARVHDSVPRESIGRIHERALQDFEPEESYDVVWIQWCVGYVTDPHLVRLLRRCAAALRPGGVLFVKENSPDDEDDFFLYDNDDHSVARSVKYFRALFRRAGLRVVAQRKHLGFPGDMLPVYMYALVPDSRPDSKRITRAS